MDCDASERAILEHGADLPDAVREHVARCPACQEFGRLQQALLGQTLSSGPSAALDRAVRRAAHRRLRRGGWRLPPLRWVYRAAAAALVLVAAVGLLSRLRPAVSPQEAVAALRPPVVAPRHWAGAEVDLEVIEGGLDAALAELGSVGAPVRGAAADAGSSELWDALMELEFDVYFESENLRQAGG